MITEEWIRKKKHALDYQLSQDAFDNTRKIYTRKDIEMAKYYLLLDILGELVREV